RAFEELLGYRRDALTGRTMVMCAPRTAGMYKCTTGNTITIDNSYFQAHRDKIAQLFEHKCVSNWESYFLRTDGTVVPVDQNMVLVYDRSGAVAGAVGVIRDITERRRSEQALRESEEKFRSVVEMANDAIFTINSKGVIVSWNKEAEAIYGYRADEIIGKLFPLIMPERFRENQIDYMQKALSMAGDTGFFIPKSEGIDLRKDGTEFPVEFTLSLWSAGDDCYFTMISRDITERKLSEEALRDSEERFRVLAQSAIDAIVVVNTEAYITFWNQGAQDMFGYREEEVLGKPIAIIVPDNKRAHFDRRLAGLNEDEQVYGAGSVVEYQGLHKNGTIIPVELSYSSWKIKNGIFYFAIVRDITQRKRSEEMLDQVNRCLLSFGPRPHDNITKVVKTAGLLMKGSMAVYAHKRPEGFFVENQWRLQLCGAEAQSTFNDFLIKLYQGATGGPVIVSSTEIDSVVTETGAMVCCIGVSINVHRVKKGILAVFCSANRFFDHNEQKILSIFAKSISSEEDRKLVIDELKRNQYKIEQSERSLKQFSGRMLSIREEEKKSLSLNLHDELGAMAVAVGTRLSIAEDEMRNSNIEGALEAFAHMKRIFKDSVSRIRQIAVDQRPPELDIIGLPSAFSDYCKNLSERSGIDITCRVELNGHAISGDAAIALYRVMQEALNNVIKHAKADRAELLLTIRNGSISFSIKDNGKGSELSGKSLDNCRELKLGIQGMRERVESLGGSFVLSSEPECGFTVTITLPYYAEETVYEY
ncbi:MAG: PAS domain S-box protein, partial [Deltaproteobacteria bacterium]|nr:PAS domain S-box protein [Deltaproteobacteria bacterium]